MATIQNILKQHDVNQLTFIDVGAKGQVEYINECSAITDIHAFEPNPEEYNLLTKLYSVNSFRAFNINPNALGDITGLVDFHITNHASMSSLLEPDHKNYQKNFGTYKEYSQWKKNITVNSTVKVIVETLDNYCCNLELIDYLKIDTQGSELSILKGAQTLLKAGYINVIKVEVSTIPVYQNQDLFSDIDLFLRKYNYQLVDFVTYRNDYQSIFKANKHHAHYAPCGDAIYVLNSDIPSAHKSLRKALVLVWLGYQSLAESFLKDTKLNMSEKNSILAIKSINQKTFYKVFFENITPPFLHRLGKKILWRIKKQSV